ncbi:MAG: HlyD family efflux transporter periplasmic adaptor subunit, partial [Candidatus Competibacteraceae bacterium]|nr:HlyD family efflux transporter periplasmic adaptor subunit [Candidatus Competibacteraceae bacterium]
TAVPGQPLLRLYDPDQLRLEASVRESLASRLQRGATLTARIDALDLELPATVDEIVPTADPGSRSFLVKAALPFRADLYPGMFGRLLIPLGTVARLYVPQEAVARFGQLEFVQVPTPQGTARRYIRTAGPGAEGRLEVLSGLSEGERVILPD